MRRGVFLSTVFQPACCLLPCFSCCSISRRRHPLPCPHDHFMSAAMTGNESLVAKAPLLKRILLETRELRCAALRHQIWMLATHHLQRWPGTGAAPVCFRLWTGAGSQLDAGWRVSGPGNDEQSLCRPGVICVPASITAVAGSCSAQTFCLLGPSAHVSGQQERGCSQ